jgi:GMP synthase-like glutamine amidotransferase
MRVHFLQHVPFEGLGSIGPWFESARAKVTGTKFFESTVLPPASEVDLLVIMGGPMSVNNEVDLPWLVSEKRFIRQVIEEGKAVVGVCLGAQLIASAMGARVYRNKEKEIGWFPISSVHTSTPGLVHAFPAETLVFHWHGETFDLPPGAVQLARSVACENQAFQLGRRVIGLQFHLEITPQGAREIVSHCRAELAPSRFVQTERQILATEASRYETVNALMGEVLKFVTRDED